MSDDDLRKIGDEMVRALQPVYEDLDELKKDVSGLKKDVKELREDVDSIKAELHDFHLESGANKDRTDTEIEKIKEHIGLIPSR